MSASPAAAITSRHARRAAASASVPPPSWPLRIGPCTSILRAPCASGRATPTLGRMRPAAAARADGRRRAR